MTQDKLQNLLQRSTHEYIEKYDAIIQHKTDIIKLVHENKTTDNILSHSVEKQFSSIPRRVIFETSAKSKQKHLNDWIYNKKNMNEFFTEFIILNIEFIANIQKAFLQIKSRKKFDEKANERKRFHFTTPNIK